MQTLRKRWFRWVALPLAVVLILATVLTVQMNRESKQAYVGRVAAINIAFIGPVSLR